MENQADPLTKDFHIKTRGGVAGLVCVHGDAGSKKDCRYPVVYEYPLVGQAVEDFCEVSAPVVIQSQVEPEGCILLLQCLSPGLLE